MLIACGDSQVDSDKRYDNSDGILIQFVNLI